MIVVKQSMLEERSKLSV